ncbi:MAG: hypothetical protein AVDCRST_MAG64-2945, partial [uncultured Phycisphaerae bacterium]
DQVALGQVAERLGRPRGAVVVEVLGPRRAGGLVRGAVGVDPPAAELLADPVGQPPARLEPRDGRLDGPLLQHEHAGVVPAAQQPGVDAERRPGRPAADVARADVDDPHEEL